MTFRASPLAVIVLAVMCGSGCDAGSVAECEDGPCAAENGIEVSVESASERRFVAGRVSESAFFVVVDVAVTNPTEAPVPVGRAMYWLETSDGLVHSAEWFAPADKTACPDDAFLSEGATTRCTVVFDPPSGSAAALRFFLGDFAGDFLRVPFTVEPPEGGVCAEVPNCPVSQDQYDCALDCSTVAAEDCCNDASGDFEGCLGEYGDFCRCARNECVERCFFESLQDCYRSCGIYDCEPE